MNNELERELCELLREFATLTHCGLQHVGTSASARPMTTGNGNLDVEMNI